MHGGNSPNAKEPISIEIMKKMADNAISNDDIKLMAI